MDKMPDDTKDRFLIDKKIIQPTGNSSTQYWLYYKWRMIRYPIINHHYFYCESEDGVNKCFSFDVGHYSEESTDSIHQVSLTEAQALFNTIKFK